MNTVPIIYIHRGYSWYLPIVLRNGIDFHGRGNVWFLGDPYANAIARIIGANSAPIKEYQKGAEAFEADYIHESNLGREFELFCLQRWFILLEFMRRQGLDAAIYLDSDILLTQHLEPYRKQTLTWPMTFTGYSAHISFINTRAVLDHFCRFTTTFYRDPDNESKRVAWRKKMENLSGSGGVSDMTLFYWFKEAHPDFIGDYRDIFKDSPFDVSLQDTRGFETGTHGFKRLIWEERTPFVKKTDGTKIALACLHHQGRAKILLKNHAKALGLKPLSGKILFPLFDILYRIFRKLRLSF